MTTHQPRQTICLSLPLGMTAMLGLALSFLSVSTEAVGWWVFWLGLGGSVLSYRLQRVAGLTRFLRPEWRDRVVTRVSELVHRSG